jgi:hypothetical protein
MNFDTISNVLDIVTSVVGTASVIAAITPTPKDDAIVAKVRKVLDLFAFNFWNAKNK